MAQDNIRDKDYVSQPKAREKLKIKFPVNIQDYSKKPEKESDQRSDVKKQTVVEENDYAGVRSVNDKKNVTEKGVSKKKKDMHG